MHYRSIHYARAGAAIMVMLFHLFLRHDFMGYQKEIHGWMRGGVDIFFIISGFVMVKATQGRSITAASFLKDRLFRILPMYWLFTTMLLGTVEEHGLYKVASYLLIPVQNPVGSYEPLLNPGWTLIIEMRFYLIFALSLLLPERMRLPTITGFLGLLGISGWLPLPAGILDQIVTPCFLEFVAGIWIARWDMKGHPVLLPVGIVAMVLMYPISPDHVVGLAPGAVMIVLGLLGLEQRLVRLRALDLLGHASYCLYLSHLLVFLLLVMLDLPTMIFAVGAPIAAVVFAIIFHIHVERPMMMWIKQRKAKLGYDRITVTA